MSRKASWQRIIRGRALSLGVLVDQVYREIPDAEAWWSRPINGRTPAAMLARDNLNELRRMVTRTLRSTPVRSKPE